MKDTAKKNRILIIVIAVLTFCVLAAAGWFAFSILSGSAPVDLAKADQLSKGDVVRFGTFEQDGDTSDGPEAIEWIVLDVMPGDDSQMKALLLSRCVLQAIPLHNVYEDITWDQCSLRTWLNEEFYPEAFTDEEKEKILLSDNENNPNPSLEPHGCGVTQDYAYVLSLEEAKAYLRTDEDRSLIGAADTTEYAVIKHLETGDETTEDAGKACWWLRTPGVYQYSAAFVDRDGTIFENGAIANHETYCGVRPALWVKMS